MLLVAVVVAVTMLSGCFPSPDPSAEKDQPPVTQATESQVIVTQVESLLGDVTSIDSTSSQNGFNTGWVVHIIRESPQPLTADQLKNLLRIVWENTSFRPVSIGIKIGSADGGIVDLDAAAEELGVTWYQYDYGVSVREETLTDLFGEWPSAR